MRPSPSPMPVVRRVPPWPRRGRVRAAAVALVLAAVALCAPLAPPLAGSAAAVPRDDGGGGGGSGGEWSAAPAGPASSAADGETDKDARSLFYLEGAPGTVLEDTVSVTNESGKARTYTLRGADAYNGRDGAFAVRGKGASTGAGRWIAFAEREVRVPARTRADVPFTVTVPRGTVPGDHPGAVVVSDGERDAGVRMRLRVTGPALSALSVEDVRVRGKDGGAAEIEYALVNRGNTALEPRLAVRADGLFGQVLRRESRALDLELLPGQRVTLSEPWHDPPSLDSTDVTLSVTAEDGARGEASGSYTTVPWGALGGGAALLALAGAVLGRRRWRTAVVRALSRAGTAPRAATATATCVPSEAQRRETREDVEDAPSRPLPRAGGDDSDSDGDGDRSPDGAAAGAATGAVK
ncbi:COG1470 family protein [Streptomyces daliensis]